MISAILLFPATSINSTANNQKDNCKYRVSAKSTKRFTKKIWRLNRWRRGQPKRAALRAYKRRLRCSKGAGHRKAIRRFWRRNKRLYYDHRKAKREEIREARRLDALTPYGNWAIPEYIVMCESGGNYRAVNGSSYAGGAYQIIPSTWAAYGGLEYASAAHLASPEAQHIIAGRIWADVGSRAWSCA